MNYEHDKNIYLEKIAKLKVQVKRIEDAAAEVKAIWSGPQSFMVFDHDTRDKLRSSILLLEETQYNYYMEIARLENEIERLDHIAEMIKTREAAEKEPKSEKKYNRTAPKKYDYWYALYARGVNFPMNTHINILKEACKTREIEVRHKRSKSNWWGLNSRNASGRLWQKQKTYEPNYFHTTYLLSPVDSYLPGGKGAAMNFYELKVRRLLDSVMEAHLVPEYDAVLILQRDLNIDLQAAQTMLMELLKIKETLEQNNND